MLLNIITLVITGAMLVIASYTDVKKSKIPNFITLPCIAAGLVTTLVSCITTGDYRNILVCCIGIVVLYLFAMFGFMGGGDIKALMAVCALRGPLNTILTAGIGSIGVLVIWLINKPDDAIGGFKNVYYSISTKCFGNVKQGGSVPFAPYMLFGFVCSIAITLFLAGRCWM